MELVLETRNLTKEYGSKGMLFAASYCKRILYLKDGKIHARIDKDSTRKEFFKRIIDSIGSMGGGIGELL